MIWKFNTDGSWGPPILENFFPKEYNKFLTDRQMMKGFNFKLFTKINYNLVLVFLILMVVVLIFSLLMKRKQDYPSFLFALLFILFNASIPAILVGITPRYHGRVVWILILISIELLNNYLVHRKSAMLPPQSQDE